MKGNTNKVKPVRRLQLITVSNKQEKQAITMILERLFSSNRYGTEHKPLLPLRHQIVGEE